MPATATRRTYSVFGAPRCGPSSSKRLLCGTPDAGGPRPCSRPEPHRDARGPSRHPGLNIGGSAPTASRSSCQGALARPPPGTPAAGVAEGRPCPDFVPDWEAITGSWPAGPPGRGIPCHGATEIFDGAGRPPRRELNSLKTRLGWAVQSGGGVVTTKKELPFAVIRITRIRLQAVRPHRPASASSACSPFLRQTQALRRF